MAFEIERKYLIEYPDLNILESYPKSDIAQTYLKTNDGMTSRVRKRTSEGVTKYIFTEKKRITDVKCIENERELSAVYENKLGKQDAEAVRTGKMPVVYSQCCLRSGQLVQSCVSYLPKDYTGERSAYLCHSLILCRGLNRKKRLFKLLDI